MVASIPGLHALNPSDARIDLVLKRRAPAASTVPRWAFPWTRADRPAPLYFAVRSAGLTASGHLLEYAFVDDRGEVVLRSSVLAESAHAPQVSAICRGARLVAFHRVLQGGLLPDGALAAAQGVDCAWRRFRQTARRRGLRLSPGEPLDLVDCLARAGLPPPALDDAASRAMAIRSLWRWMDKAG